MLRNLSVLCILFALCVSAQTAPVTPQFLDTLVGGGVFWNEYATPQISGDAFFAKLESGGMGLYSYTEFLITSTTDATTHKWTLGYTPTTGQAIYLRSFGAWKLFADGTVGPSTALAAGGGTNVGLGLAGGGFAVHPLGKGGFRIILAAQALSVEAAKGRASQFQYGANLAWGK